MTVEVPRKPSGMLVATKGGTRYHNITGRELNPLRNEDQTGTAALFSRKLETMMSAPKIAEIVISEYRAEYRGTYNSTIDKIYRLVSWMIFNPNKNIKINNKVLGVNSKTKNRMVSFLESKGYISVYQGYGLAGGGGKAMSVSSTNALLSLNDKNTLTGK